MDTFHVTLPLILPKDTPLLGIRKDVAMKKTLVCVDTLDEHICKAEHKLYMEGKILTASARDELTKRGVAIVFGPEPHEALSPVPGPETWEATVAACCCQKAAASCSGLSPELEQVVQGLAAVIKEQCGISDPAQLRALSLEAADVIRKNL